MIKKILKIPFSFNLSDYDCNGAPNKILGQLKNYYINESFKKINYKISDMLFENPNDKDVCHEKIQAEAGKSIEQGYSIFLGGDHSISAPVVKAVSDYCKKQEKKLGLFVFDAHLDMAKPIKSATNEDWLRWLIEHNIVKPENVFVYGVRNIDKTELDFAKSKGIRFMMPKGNFNNDLYFIMEKMQQYDVIYVSIDVDVVDPAFAPGVNFPEPGGITSRQLIAIIQKINLLNKKKFFDVVEVDPKKDINNITIKLAAKIVGEIT